MLVNLFLKFANTRVTYPGAPTPFFPACSSVCATPGPLYWMCAFVARLVPLKYAPAARLSFLCAWITP